MMPTLSELHLLQWRFPPGVLVMLLPALLHWRAWRQRRKLTRYADPHLLPWAASGRTKASSSMVRRMAELLAWGLLALAAAGPRLATDTGASDPHSTPTHALDVMVVLDVSASMNAADIAPDRLSRARLELDDLQNRLQGERLGLMLFAGQSGLLLPPTQDMMLFQRALVQSGTDLLEASGTDVAQALRLAHQVLSLPQQGTPQSQRSSRAILLVTDAESTSLEGAALLAARQASESLRQAGIPLFILVTASAAGSAVTLPSGETARRDGQAFISQPALRAFEELAHLTHGALSLVTDNDADWRALYDHGIARLPGSDPGLQTSAPLWRELFPLPLGGALALLFWLYLPASGRRASSGKSALVATMVTAALNLTVPTADAAEAPAIKPSQSALAAAQAWRAGAWGQALPLFERQGGYAGYMGAGASAWKLRDFSGAAHFFGQALLLARNDAERDDALYNLGNAHFGQGRWLSAAQAWRTVLLSRPGDSRAAANLVHAEAQLAKRGNSVAMKSDLRGRRGFIAEGLVSVDGATPTELDESSQLPDITHAPGAAKTQEATGARLGADAQPAVSGAAIEPQRLQSGLVKIERLQDRQRALLQGLLKQDRTPSSTASSPMPPW